jgi:Cytochrome c554 and c-prime
MTWQRKTIPALLGLGAVAILAALVHSEPAEQAPRPVPLGDSLSADGLLSTGSPLEPQWRLAAKAAVYRGTENCERCHTAPRPGDPAVPNHVLLNEAARWKNEDHHYLAYDHLRDGLGQKIGQRLGANVLDPAAGCVQCHTTSEQVIQSNARSDKAHAEGVGCEACHGPAERWIGEHNIHDKWYAKSRDAKTAEGWIDIRSAGSRAELCLSCHVGSAPDNRVVTHSMYAAGHPPLTGFEIESFADMMPRHWRYPYNKPNPPRESSFDRTRDILTASVVAMRMAMDVTVADATASNQPERWPEFARLDCFTCHHDVEETDWRRRESGILALGRPRLIAGCLPLVAVALQVVQGPTADQKLDALAQQLQAPFATNAFGDPAEIAEQGTKVVASCRNLERRLDATPLTPAAAGDVLHSIAREASTDDRDFDTARQLFGAWSVVWQELVDNHVLPKSPAVERGIASGKIFFSLDNGKPNNSPASAPGPRPVTDELNELFGNRAKYDPAKFAHGMSTLDALTLEPSTEADH